MDTATLTSAFSTGLTSLASDVTSMITTVAPIAIGIAATIFVARRAMGWFKGMAK